MSTSAPRKRAKPTPGVRRAKKVRPPSVETAPTHKPGSELTEWQNRALNAENSSPNKNLTELQKLFVHHWAQGESIHSASIRAGYKDGGAAAYALVKTPAAQALYAKEKKHYEEAAQMTRKKVMDGLLEAAEMAKLMAEPASMVSAWREIGKMCGYYAPVEKKITISTDGKRARMERMTDAELEELVGAKIPEGVLEAVGDDRDDGDD